MNKFDLDTGLPKVGDEITLSGEKRTVTGIAKNNAGDPIVCWTSSREEGGCMPVIWREWVKYAKQNKPLPTHRRSDMFD